MNHSWPTHFYKTFHSVTIWKPSTLTGHKPKFDNWAGVIKSYIDGSVVVGYVYVAILNDQPSSQLLHLQTVQRSLRI